MASPSASPLPRDAPVMATQWRRNSRACSMCIMASVYAQATVQCQMRRVSLSMGLLRSLSSLSMRPASLGRGRDCILHLLRSVAAADSPPGTRPWGCTPWLLHLQGSTLVPCDLRLVIALRTAGLRLPVEVRWPSSSAAMHGNVEGPSTRQELTRLSTNIRHCLHKPCRSGIHYIITWHFLGFSSQQRRPWLLWQCTMCQL